MIDQRLQVYHHIRITACQRHPEARQALGERHRPDTKLVLPASLVQADEIIPVLFIELLARNRDGVPAAAQQFNLNEVSLDAEQFFLLLQIKVAAIVWILVSWTQDLQDRDQGAGLAGEVNFNERFAKLRRRKLNLHCRVSVEHGNGAVARRVVAMFFDMHIGIPRARRLDDKDALFDIGHVTRRQVLIQVHPQQRNQTLVNRRPDRRFFQIRIRAWKRIRHSSSS